MLNWSVASKLYLFVFVVVGCLVVWDLNAALVSEQSFTETFDSEHIEDVLGGQIVENGHRSPWTVYVNGDKLVWKNRTHKQKTHFQTIPWVKFDGRSELSRLTDPRISVTVGAEPSGRGGAGLFIQQERRGQYWMFTVDDDGGYHILRKGLRALSPIANGQHAAIRKNEENRLSFYQNSDFLIFHVNGEEVIKVPKAGKRDMPTTVGLVAFGKGRFEFDDLNITETR